MKKSPAESTIDTQLERKHEFAAHRFVAGLQMRPSLQTIISCVDPCVDPVHILGLEPGKAAVLRNVGGRVTPGTLQLLSMLLQVPAGAGAPADTNPSAPFHLIVLHHTDWGIIRLASKGAGAPADTNPSAPFHLIVLHHTDWGIIRLASKTELMSDYFDIPPVELPAKANLDPHSAVASDIATLRAIPAVPSTILVSSLVYDMETG